MTKGRSEIVETLNNSKIARLATVDPENNQPYLIPVVFVFNGTNIFMFGEYVTAIRFDHIIKEILLKTSFDNLFRSITVIICTSY